MSEGPSSGGRLVAAREGGLLPVSQALHICFQLLLGRLPAQQNHAHGHL
jgi:hypothetical protein